MVDPDEAGLVEPELVEGEEYLYDEDEQEEY